jgi:SAM-dependent methyltransferase
MEWISIAVLAFSVVAAAVTIGVYFRTGVPPLPTSPFVLGPLLVLVERVPRRRVVDLGGGYGTLVLAVAERCPRAEVVGYEISPIPFLISWVRVRLSRLPNVAVRFGDAFAAELDGVDLVLCYLTREPMARLGTKLGRELSAGAELICHTFALPGWEPQETIRAQDLYHTPVYRYIRPQQTGGPVRHPWMERPARPGAAPSGLLEP